MTAAKPSVLFLCVASSARSQMAEGFGPVIFEAFAATELS